MLAQATEDGVSEIQVDLLANMPIDSITSPESQLAFTREDDVVVVDLGQSFNAGGQFELTVFYYGHPMSTSTPFGGFDFGVRYLVWPYLDGLSKPVFTTLSQPYGARSWWPCKDRPDDKADSMRATFTVNKWFYAVSNGNLDSVVTPFGQGSLLRYHYTMTQPIVTYLFALSMTDYWVWYDQWIYNDDQDTMPIINHVFPEWLDGSYVNFEDTKRGLTILSEKFGLYPFADMKYGHVGWWSYAGMEHQTITSIFGRHYVDYPFEPLVIHELAHSWWGNMITCKSYHDIWLNEGWATYSEAVYFQHRLGWRYYHEYMNYFDYADGGTIYRSDTTSPDLIFDLIVYDKAAWVVHMLRHVLGDSLFFAGIHTYYDSEYKHGSLDTWEFCELWEEATGRDLHWFFEDWIFGEYRPNYRYCWWNEPSDSGGYDVALVVDQHQTTDPQVFRMPVDFVLHLDSGPLDTITLWVGQRRNTYVFNFPDSLVDVELDPSGWVLKYESNAPWYLHFVTLSTLPSAQEELQYEVTLDTRGGSGSNTFSITDGALPNGLTMDEQTGVITGTPTDSGSFTFTANVDDDYSNFWDEATFVLHVEHTPLIPGDIDVSGSVDIADLIYIVDYSFTGGPAPLLPNLADVDGSCGIDIADIVHLVDYMFVEGPPPVMGCVE